MISRRTALSLLATSGIIPIPAMAAADGPPTIEELLEPQEVGLVTISPNGQLVAVLRGRKVGNDFKYRITIHPFDNLNATQYYELPNLAGRIMWLSDERLAVQTFGLTFTLGGMFVGGIPTLAFITPGAPGMKPLGNLQFNKMNLAYLGLIEILSDDDSHIVIMVREPTGIPAIYKYGPETGSLEFIDRGIASTVAWTTRDGRPLMRSDAVPDQPITNLMAPDETGKWRRVRQLYASSLIAQDFNIVGATPEPGVVMVAARAQGQDTRGIHKFDLKSMNWGQTVSSRPGCDASDSFVDRWGRYLGAIYQEDTLVYDCSDPALTANLDELRRTFPGNNIRIADVSRDMNRLIIAIDGPQLPGLMAVFDRKLGALGPVGAMRPSLTPSRLAAMRTLDIHTRDGTTQRAYLSVPPGHGRRPLIVLPHGGPEARDWMQFDVLTQMLAAQGWLVLQPNFRGSDGYGLKFAEAGHREWGGKVLDDIDDAVNQVLTMEEVDPKRVAVFGWSFGGYAALSSALRRPELYRAIVSVAGPTDLERSLQTERRAGDASISYQYWLHQIGDPKSDIAAIRAASPAKRAAEFKAPILLIHGTEDENVNIDQSRIMDLALSRARKPYKFRQVEGGDHGGNWPTAIKASVYGDIVKFIRDEFAKVVGA